MQIKIKTLILVIVNKTVKHQLEISLNKNISKLVEQRYSKIPVNKISVIY